MISIPQVSEMGWRGWTPVGGDTKRQLDTRKNYYFVIEDYIEAVKQSQKIDLHLVESTMQPTDPMEE